MTPRLAPPPIRRAYVLAGRATRLPGKFLRRIDGEPLINRELRTLGACELDTTVVSVGPLDLPGVAVVTDRLDAGPLGGLATVLELTDEPFFLFGADMPFLDPSAIATMRSCFDGRSLVPRSVSGHLAVLHAIYWGVTRDEVGEVLGRAGGLVDLVHALSVNGRVRFLPPGTLPERSFSDIDTPEDLAGAEGRVGTSVPDR